MFSSFCWEHLRIRSSVPSIISAMAGISTRVSVHTTVGETVPDTLT